jgi:RND family efflux transporter MFP subunit
MANSRLIVRLGAVAVVVALVAFLAPMAFRPQARVAKVFPGKAIDQVPGSVVVRAEYAMQLKSETGGRVLESELDEGKVVKEGEFLVQLDPADLILEIERIENDLKAAQARAELGPLTAIDLEGAKADLVAAERQLRLGSISESEFQKHQRQVTQLEKKAQLEDVANKQQVENLENALRTKKRQLEKMRITAWFDGKVSEVFARKGDLIGSGSPIATVISTSRTVEAKISEENFAGIKLDQRALVRFLGYGNQLYDGRVIKVLPTADPETQRYIVHLEVKIDPELLVPGITGEVNIVVNERDSQTIIPRRALFQNSVYVVNDGKIEQRRVEIGFTSLNQVEILKGLKQGELVVVEDLDRFRPGDSVRTKLVD